MWIRRRAGRTGREIGLVFTSSIGTPLDPCNLYRRFVERLARAGASKIRFPDLRPTAASILFNRGGPVTVGSRMLGHSYPTFTLDIYGRLIQSMQ